MNSLVTEVMELSNCWAAVSGREAMNKSVNNRFMSVWRAQVTKVHT